LWILCLTKMTQPFYSLRELDKPAQHSMNKTTLRALFLAVVLGIASLSTTFAGAPVDSSKKETTPLDENFFNKGFEFSLSGIYEGGNINPEISPIIGVGGPRTVIIETRGNTRIITLPGTPSAPGATQREFTHNAGGVGLDAAYFFTRNLGIDVGTAWTEGDGSVFELSASLVYRVPIMAKGNKLGIAPYVLAGGDGLFGHRAIAGGHVGGGVEFRLCKHGGIFIDGRWVFGDDSVSFGSVHSGFRFAF
jgi:hypothetical protein